MAVKAKIFNKPDKRSPDFFFLMKGLAEKYNSILIGIGLVKRHEINILIEKQHGIEHMWLVIPHPATRPPELDF